MSEEDRDVEDLIDTDPEDLTDRELMLALSVYAERKGKAEARWDHICTCADRRRSGLLLALRNVVKTGRSRVSRRYVEGMETTVTETFEEREEEFQEYLTEATARFDDDPTAASADLGFW